MSPPVTDHPAASRLPWLDGLRVLAISGVFLFHAIHPFDEVEWHIKNAEQSRAVTVIIVLANLWGMPLFFLLAGAASRLALTRRTPGQYVAERLQWNASLLIKLLVVVLGSLLACLGFYEALIRQVDPLRVLFGVPPRRRLPAQRATPVLRPG